MAESPKKRKSGSEEEQPKSKQSTHSEQEAKAKSPGNPGSKQGDVSKSLSQQELGTVVSTTKQMDPQHQQPQQLAATGGRKKVSTENKKKVTGGPRRVATAIPLNEVRKKRSGEPTQQPQKGPRHLPSVQLRKKKSADKSGKKVEDDQATVNLVLSRRIKSVQPFIVVPTYDMSDLNSDCEGIIRAQAAKIEELDKVEIVNSMLPINGIQQAQKTRLKNGRKEMYQDGKEAEIFRNPMAPHEERRRPYMVKQNRKLKVAILPEAERAQSKSTTHDWPDRVKNLVVDYRDIINKTWNSVRINMPLSEAYRPKMDEALKITYEAYKIFKNEPNLIDVAPPVTVVGDIHGQCPDLMAMLAVNGPPPRTRYVFLGDYVDRGVMSLQVINMLMCYKILFPRSVTLLRGNHEIQRINARYGFIGTVEESYRNDAPKEHEALYYLYNKVFNYMPLAALIAAKILCMHGGISPQLKSLDEIRLGRKPVRNPCYGYENDLMWADPEAGCGGWKKPTRGSGCIFGEEVLDEFCRRNNISMVVRAHQVVITGFIVSPSLRLVTLFSAPMYTNSNHNAAAIMHVDKDLRVKFSCFVPESHGVVHRIGNFNRVWDESVNNLMSYIRGPF